MPKSTLQKHICQLKTQYRCFQPFWLLRTAEVIFYHIEGRFPKAEISTGVSNSDFVFKHEGHRIQYLFNNERSEKISNIQRHNDVSSMKRQDQHDEVEYSFLN